MTCPKDDSGTPCKDCICKYNPVVVIATHQRKEITTKNIELLKQQSFVPRIVIVCSLHTEFEYYKTLGVSVILEANNPLGRKWQCGVHVAHNMNANPLIILGSDDILKKDFIKNALLKLNQGYEFIGYSAWYTYNKKHLYKSTYVNRNEGNPIGSGKVYSKEILSRIRYKVFDTGADRRLDDQGTRLIKNEWAKTIVLTDPDILAVKGNWGEMNTLDAYLKSPNIRNERIKDHSDVLKQFGY
jgi:hypothetical protein